MAIDQKMQIESRAPTRIDLAGGTVDIWPIYLFLSNPITLNLAIDLFAEAKILVTPESSGRSRGIKLRSDDQGTEFSLDWDSLQTASAPASLELHLKLLRHFAELREKTGLPSGSQSLTLSTRARSPAGAGLGGSSALSVAVIGALATWAKAGSGPAGSVDPMQDGERFIEIARDVETTVIQVPAGMQDYYGAMFGGLQSLRWLCGKNSRGWLPEEILAQLEERVLLFYSGQSRNSGINNWALFKAFVDRQGEVRSQFERIVQATLSLETALREKDWTAAAKAIRAEWSVRRTLAAGISTSEMDKAFDLADREGAAAGKVCGAGGGGCFFLFLPSADPQLKKRLQNQIESLGVRSLPFRTVPRGLEVRVNDS